MSTKQYSLTLKVLLLFITLVLSACQPVFVAPTSEAVTDGSSLTFRSETAFGRFNGIDFVKYEGLFTNPADGNPYSAPFEIVAPATPAQGNGRLLLEPYHFILGAGARDGMLTPEFLFSRGFSYAAICWQPPLPDVAESHPCADFAASPGTELRIISDFGKALSQDQAAKMIGDVAYLYAIGVSNSSDPLHRLLLDPLGQGLFDLSVLLTTGWPLPVEPFAPLPETMSQSLVPNESAGRVLVIQSEADLILFNGEVLRDDGTHANYRSYEVAGGQHIQGSLPGENIGLEFMPVMRALFVAGDRWVQDGSEPPASLMLEAAAASEIDPVYERETGIARDDNMNARGGIRLPDLALGRHQYIATNVDTFLWVGAIVDLACTPLADGSIRFDSNDAYVSRFGQETARLVDEGFLLPDDAYHMIVAAAESDVGRPDSCP